MDTGSSLKVTSIDPPNGPAAGGTTLTINGTGFTPGSKVKFGNVPATNVTFIASNKLTATSPATTVTGSSTILGTDSVWNNNGFVAGGSSTPTPITLPVATGRVLTLNSVTGQVTVDPVFPFNGADGGSYRKRRATKHQPD